MTEQLRESQRKARLISTDDENRSAVFLLTNGSVDRDGETVDPEGADLSDYSKNSVVAFNHSTDNFPIGMMHPLDPGYSGAPEIWLDDVDGQKALLGRVYFSKENPQGDLAYRMVREGSLKGGSISFLPNGGTQKNDSGGNHYSKWRLLEFSVCPLPSNPDALRMSKKLKDAASPCKAVVEKKADGWYVRLSGGITESVRNKAVALNKRLKSATEPTEKYLPAVGDYVMAGRPPREGRVVRISGDQADVDFGGSEGITLPWKQLYQHPGRHRSSLKSSIEGATGEGEFMDEVGNAGSLAWQWLNKIVSFVSYPLRALITSSVRANRNGALARNLDDWWAQALSPKEAARRIEGQSKALFGEKSTKTMADDSVYIDGRIAYRSGNPGDPPMTDKDRRRRWLAGYYDAKIGVTDKATNDAAQVEAAIVSAMGEKPNQSDLAVSQTTGGPADYLSMIFVRGPYTDAQLASVRALNGRQGWRVEAGFRLGKDEIWVHAIKARAKAMKRKLWTNKNRAWLLKSDGMPDAETQEYLEERGLDDVRIEEPPPEESGEVAEEWAEEEIKNIRESPAKIRQNGSKWYVYNDDGDDLGDFDGYSSRAEAQKEADLLNRQYGLKSISKGLLEKDDGETSQQFVRRVTVRSAGEVGEQGSGYFVTGQTPRDILGGPYASRSDAMNAINEAAQKSIRKASAGDFKVGDRVFMSGEEGGSGVVTFVSTDYGGRVKVRFDAEGTESEVSPRLLTKKSIRNKSDSPAGYRALSKWIKMLEDDSRDIEKSEVLDAKEEALKALKRALKRAYKDMGDPEVTDKNIDWTLEKLHAMRDGESKIINGQKVVRRAVDSFEFPGRSDLSLVTTHYAAKILEGATKSKDMVTDDTDSEVPMPVEESIKAAMDDGVSIDEACKMAVQDGADVEDVAKAKRKMLAKNKGSSSDMAEKVWEILRQAGRRATMGDVLTWINDNRIKPDADPKDVADEYMGKSLHKNNGHAKRLSKSERDELQEMAAFLTDVADAGDTPKRLSAGMRHYASKIKQKFDDMDAVGSEEVAEDIAPLEAALKVMQDEQEQLNKSLYRATGQRI